MLCDEPRLQFVGANDVVQEQIIRALVVARGREARHRASLPEHNPDTLGHCVNQLHLFCEMFVEEQVKLEKRGTRQLP